MADTPVTHNKMAFDPGFHVGVATECAEESDNPSQTVEWRILYAQQAQAHAAISLALSALTKPADEGLKEAMQRLVSLARRQPGWAAPGNLDTSAADLVEMHLRGLSGG